jgi:hypothetical protein
VKPAGPEALRILELEARVAALEEILEARSQRLRRLQPRLCRRDLRLLDLILSGGGDLDLSGWEETTDLSPADVEETLETLWAGVRQERATDPSGRSS